MSDAKERVDTYQIITDRIIASLEHGTIPWHMPWQEASQLQNMRGTRYHGMNVLILWATSELKGYTCNTWATFNQIRQAGGMVKAGEHGTPVCFWKFFKTEGKTDIDGQEAELGKVIPMLRYYTVFNLCQQEGIPLPTVKTIQHDPIAEAEAAMAKYTDKPAIHFAPGRAFYLPGTDTITAPPIDNYRKAEEYYSTLFHESVHSTGHKNRLDRASIAHIGRDREDRSKEELIAEIGAAFLCAETGIVDTTLDNSAAYIASWLTVLKGDRRFIVTAAGAAQRAVEYMIGKAEIIEEPIAA